MSKKIPDVFLESKAFQSLTTEAARQVFVVLLEKQKAKVLNDGQIAFTYQEASERGISADRFTRAIDQLIEVGLIDILEKKRRRPNQFPTTLYALSKRWKNYGRKCFRYRERTKRRLAPVFLKGR